MTPPSDALVIPLAPGSTLKTQVRPPRDRSSTERATVERAWADACAQNPRLFDGPMLASEGLDEHDTLQIRRETYKHLVTTDDVRQLGVNAMLISSSDEERVLIGRRGAGVRAYNARWELAPAGGLEPVPGSPSALTEAHIITQLIREADEEVGLELDPSWCRPVCVVRDFGEGRHDNIVVRVDLPADQQCATCRTDAWEYPELAWLTRDEVTEFARSQPDAMIPPTLAVLRWAEWIAS